MGNFIQLLRMAEVSKKTTLAKNSNWRIHTPYTYRWHLRVERV